MIEDEITAFSEASTAYANDPTIEKCEIYKDAANDYVEALRGVSSSCIPEDSEQEYQEFLTDAEQSVNEIDCTETQGE